MRLSPGLRIISEMDSFSTRSIAYQVRRSAQNFLMFPGSRSLHAPRFTTPGHFPLLESLLKGNDTSTVASSRFNLPDIHLHLMSTSHKWNVYCQMRSTGQISRLTVGPSFFPDDPLLSSAPVDWYLVPSQWVLESVTPMPLKAKTRIWMAGVDTYFWKPEPDQLKPANYGLLYLKNSDERTKRLCREILELSSVSWTIVRYGRYSQQSFLRQLRRSSFMVVLGGSESQGLAHFEAWSTNRPTFVFDPCEPVAIQTKQQTLRLESGSYSRSPYLSELTGSFWSSLSELKSLIDNLSNKNYEPRKWVIQNASVEICRESFLNAIDFADPLTTD